MNNPRDFRDWIRAVERQGVQLRGIPAMITETVEVIRDGQAQDLTRHPAAPVELVYQTAFYLDTSSRRRVRFLLDFPDVVFHTDGTPATIQHYELWAKEETPSALVLTTNAAPSQALPGATLPGLVSTASNEAIAAQEKPWTMLDTNLSSFFRTDGFIAGSVWRFRARAVGAGTVTPGEWSEDLVVQMLADLNPPPQPTAPTVLAQRGTLTVSWDGQSVSGVMPADFKYAILAHGTSSSPTFEIARFGRGGGFKVVADLEYYDPQFFRIRGVDESGNLGPWSEQAVGYTTPLVDRDVILSTIDAAKTHLKNIDAGVSILENTIITEHLVVTEEMTAAIANFLYVRADKIDVNSLAADEVFTGLLDAKLVVSDMFEGKAFVGGTFTTSFGGKFQTDVEDLVGIKLDATALKAWSASGVETFALDALTGALTVFGGTITGANIQSSEWAARGIKFNSAGLSAYNSTGKLTFYLDAAQGDAQFDSRVIFGKKETTHWVTVPWESVDQERAGVWLVQGNSNGIGGDETAGVYMDNANGTFANPLKLRGMNGGGVTVQGAVLVAPQVTTPNVLSSSGAFHIQSNTQSYLPAMQFTGRVMMDDTPGVTGTANAIISATGVIQKNTSASRYKVDPQEMDLPDALLEVPVKDWLDRTTLQRQEAFEASPRPHTEEIARELEACVMMGRIPGVIAEEVEASSGPSFVTYGMDGLIESVAYDRYALARTQVLKRQLDAAVARIEKLEEPAV